MKTKKNRFNNLLKFGVFLFGISLLLWNCEKEDEPIYEQSNLITTFSNQFKSENFKEVLPHIFLVDWSNPQKQYSEQLGASFYEFPIRYVNTLFNPTVLNKISKRKYYRKYKVIVIEKKNEQYEFFLAKFYQEKNEKILNLETSKVTLNKNFGYDGITHLFNSKLEKVFSKRITLKEIQNPAFSVNLEPEIKNNNESQRCRTVYTRHYKDGWRHVYDLYGNYLYTQYMGVFYSHTTSQVVCDPIEPSYDIDEINCQGECIIAVKDVLFCPNGDPADENGNCYGEGNDLNVDNILTPEQLLKIYRTYLTEQLSIDQGSLEMDWVNDNMNSHAVEQIYNYLSSYDFDGGTTAIPADVISFGLQAISALMDTTNYISTFEEFEAYYCDCNCSGTETGFISNLSNNMEPKWGQLANKQEILSEINSITNLSFLTFENQILALESHFNKNIIYTRNLGVLSISNIQDDVNKYIYTKIAGWLDFYHVFKLFKWAKDRGPSNALLSGEIGELVQQLNGNYSAYSYEDLPSNNVGVALYIRFGRQLEQGTITWSEAVDIALEEMQWVKPEDSPNFDYIPHIVNSLYPRNFTYMPILGDLLKNFHKDQYCKRPIQEQKNIREAHENFRR